MFIYTFVFHLRGDFDPIVVRADDEDESWELAAAVGARSYRCSRCGDQMWRIESVRDFREVMLEEEEL